ncbi:hypothetical protein [Desulfosporosinus lacus]|uniref:Uncharacterized protein n=1 Tax=Desulfosporosinus lacus DSM 15449 TaxID=1121420 RepID=A0A1M5QB36_9FIRM|nr:hypothetical protein [Desulfosporosinus lacus]SHH10959.1 hypothetical protein SAMN02746098_00190 [Desulfosporosinus lacus DSM 15449]
MGSKKIILFIVEGITDQTCLGYVLSKIINSNRIEFKLTNGDITTKSEVNSSNIPTKLVDVVREFSGKIFKARDFCEIVHLIDMDGAFIPDNQLVEKTPETPVDPSDLKKLYYSDNQIFVNNIVDTQQRNCKKKAVINRLITLKSIWKTIPYSVYFFSCNLDHVLHGERNLLGKDKFPKADAFNAQFEICNGDSSKQFLDFLNTPEFAVTGSYDETWTFIKADTNSLNRYTNFHLYFSNPKNPRDS